MRKYNLNLEQIVFEWFMNIQYRTSLWTNGLKISKNTSKCPKTAHDGQVMSNKNNRSKIAPLHQLAQHY